MKLKSILVVLLLSAFALGQATSRSGGRYIARNYNYSGIQVISGNQATGTASITVSSSTVTLRDGTVIAPFNVNAPITVGVDTFTPTALSNCGSGQPSGVCTITGSISHTHGQGDQVSSGSYGLQEAVNDAYKNGGGIAVVDAGYQGTQATIAAAIGYPSVAIEDATLGPPQYWNLAQSSATNIAVPATLTAVTALPSATPVGAYGTGTYYLCVSYVDLMGNEGPCSLTFNEAGLATGSFIFTPPAASAGAVGYTIYISLTSGSYAFAYKVPLTASICTLTKVETVTAACAVTNATYGQTGATATVTAITVNTARLAPQLGVVSSTTDYVPNSNARISYAYVPGTRVGLAGVVQSSLPFTITTAALTTVPNVLGTLTLPANFMNYVGKTLRVCGHATATGTSTATILGISLWWDADGSNAAGVPAVVGGPRTTITLASAADHYSFCQDLKTTVAGASATAGSLLPGQGWLSISDTVDGTHPMTSPNATVGAVGSLNLAGEARIDVVYLHTTGTDGTGIILQDLTAEVIN